MKVELIRYPSAEDWEFVKRCTLVTVGKEAKTPPTDKWKRDLLRARHSPIRELRFAFYLEVPYWVSVHLCRHVHAQPYVRSQRDDRQSEYKRGEAPQNATVSMIWTMNAEELVTIANKRLCKQAAKETREVVRSMCRKVLAVCPEFEGQLVPMCIRNGGVCHEMFSCRGNPYAETD